MSRKAALSAILILLVGSTAFGREWARKMFEVHKHDFGSVARGAKAQFEFDLSNIYLEDVHIVSATPSCSCTQVEIKQPTLKTYEKGAIVATINTKAFRGSKGATITVRFDKPYPAQIQLNVKVYIRSDVVLDPGSVQLGSVDEGQSAAKTVSVNYAGRSNWQILGVESENPHLTAKVVETSRRYGQVKYALAVQLDPSAPVGYVNERLLLKTNDRSSPQIPVHVDGRVLSGITVSPASLFMGVVHPGEKVTKRLIVRGKKPFKILSVACDEECFEVGAVATDVAKSVHIIPVTFVAGADAGRVAKTIRIETDLGDTPPELAAYAVVSAP